MMRIVNVLKRRLGVASPSEFWRGRDDLEARDERPVETGFISRQTSQVVFSDGQVAEARRVLVSSLPRVGDGSSFYDVGRGVRTGICQVTTQEMAERILAQAEATGISAKDLPGASFRTQSKGGYRE